MRRVFVLILLLSPGLIWFFCRPDPGVPSPSSPLAFGSASIQRVLDLPEEKIDVGLAALTVTKEVSPDIDIAAYSARIDALAEKVRRLARESRDPEQRIRCLNTVLLLQEGFQGTRDLSQARRAENCHLTHVLDTRRGNCVSMPLLYIAVAQRLGWPVHLVHAPDHSFVRYVDPRLNEQNIETTSNGGYVPDDDYARTLRVSQTSRAQGTYLRTLSHRELLSDLAAVNGITFGQRGDHAKAVAYFELATRLNERNAAAWNNLRTACKALAKRSHGAEADNYREAAAHALHRRDALGFVHPNDMPPQPFRRLKNES